MSEEKSSSAAAGLIAVIGDEDTVTGFLLAGIGQRDIKGKTNFLVVDREKTKIEEIEHAFKEMTARQDIAIILINQTIADEIRYAIDAYHGVIPTVLEIPSKNQPFDESKDATIQRVLKLLGRDA